MNVIDTIFAVFTEIMDWFVGSIESVTAIFYGTDGITFLGTLALCSLGIGIVLLLCNIVKAWVQFK